MTDNDPPENKILGLTPADVPLDKLPTVTLTDEQLQKAQRIAEARNSSYSHIDGGRVCGEQSSREAHITGARGELVYATRYDAQIDDSVYSFGDDGHDFCSGPITIDIKATDTDIDRPALIVPIDPPPTADLFFLVHWLGDGTGRIIGFATHPTVTDRDPVRQPGDDLNFVVEQEELWLPPGMRDAVDDESISR